MSNELNWYQKQDECRKANNTETLPRTDVLKCVKFKGACGMVKCHNAHNTPLSEPRNRFYRGESAEVEFEI